MSLRSSTRATARGIRAATANSTAAANQRDGNGGRAPASRRQRSQPYGTVMSAASAKKVGVPSGACVIARTTAEATRQTPPARTRREMRNDANAKCKMRNAKMRMGDGGSGMGEGDQGLGMRDISSRQLGVS